MIVKPFRGIRPRADLASRIPSYPYDVLSAEEARRLAHDDPYSFLHVIRPEVDLEPGADPHEERVYALGREAFLSMIERGWLVRDEAPAYYVYRLRMDDHVQTGIIGAAAVDDYANGRIKRHEHTRPDKEEDRARMIEALSAHPGPVLLAYRGADELDGIVEATLAAEAQARYTADDGVEHALWVVSEERTVGSIERLFREVPCTYIADGHHRAAAAARVCLRRRAALRHATGAEPCQYFMAAHFPADRLRVLDYNRLVADLHGMTPDSFLRRVREAGFELRPAGGDGRPGQRRSFGMYLAGRWYRLIPQPRILPPDDAVDRTDVSILAERLLAPLLGIGDPRTDERIDFVGGIRGPGELERRVDSGEHALAFALYPTSLADVMEVADAGGVMPPKSTWFEPKLRSGLVVQPLSGRQL